MMNQIRVGESSGNVYSRRQVIGGALKGAVAGLATGVVLSLPFGVVDGCNEAAAVEKADLHAADQARWMRRQFSAFSLFPRGDDPEPTSPNYFKRMRIGAQEMAGAIGPVGAFLGGILGAVAGERRISRVIGDALQVGGAMIGGLFSKVATWAMTDPEKVRASGQGELENARVPQRQLEDQSGSTGDERVKTALDQASVAQLKEALRRKTQ